MMAANREVVELMPSAGGPMTIRIPVTGIDQVGQARRAAHSAAAGAGLVSEMAGVVALIATELATNLARHAQYGALMIRSMGADDGHAGVELVAVDKGPGIRDFGRAMRDGFSTAGSAGKGLSAITRNASEFDCYSTAESGSAILARVYAPGRRESGRYQQGVVCLPLDGQIVCGDAWLVDTKGASLRAVMIDGLGHGLEAAMAGSEAIRVMRESASATPADAMRAIHGALRATRGAAAAVAMVDTTTRHVRFAGIGNITASVVGIGSMRRMASHNGIVGHQIRTIHEFEYELPPHGYLILHSDGLSARWSLDAYPGLIGHDPAIVAGVLHRDFGRHNDDASILALRHVAG
jgi:anti-sigma regulatory factor (Ser/Thr protein kinase)